MLKILLMKKHFTFIILFIFFLSPITNFSQVTKNFFINTNNKTSGYFFNDKKSGYCLVKNIDGSYKISSYKILKQDTVKNDDTTGIPDKYNITSKVFLSRGKSITSLKIPLFYRNDNTIMKVIEVKITLVSTSVSISYKSTFKDTSVLASGKWVKVKLNADGIYKITYSDLVNMGFNNPHDVRIFGYSGGMISNYVDNSYIDDLPEVPVYYATGNDGVFGPGDYILFYAQSPNKWYWSSTSQMMLFSWNLYDSYSYYFITCNQGAPKQITYPASPTGIPTAEATTYLAYSAHDVQSENLTHSGTLWVGESFDYRTPDRDITFNFTHLDLTQDIKAKIYVAAHSAQNSTFDIRLNGTHIGTLSISHYGQYSYGNSAVQTFQIPSSSNTLKFTLTYNYPDYDSKGWLNYIDINAIRKLIYSGNGLFFNNIPYVSDSAFVKFKILNQSTTTPVIWDITDPHNIKYVAYETEGSYIVFKDSATQRKFYYMFDGTVYKKPVFVENVTNQNLHAVGNYDFIIITHPAFMKEAQELADFHKYEDNLDCGVFDVNQIYNEFASGRKEAGAIRNFLRMYYQKAENGTCKMPQYVLLFGDGSYDNKNHFSGNTNFIPTYQWGSTLDYTSTLVMDDFFVLLDEGEGGGNGYIDMGIGRFPVKTEAEAKLAVAKVKHYYSTSTFGTWRTNITFIADDEDSGMHLYQANSIADYVMNHYPMFNVKKIFLDAYQQINTPSGESYPEATTEVNNVINNGTLIMNYTGHGNERGLAAEYVVSVEQMNKWNNFDKMPLFITASCEFAPFDNYNILSAGEALFLNERGGAIALLATTRLSSAGQNATLNSAFYQNAFVNNFNDRLGDTYMKTKWMAGTDYNKRKFALLGDPAMRLAFPRYQVVTDSFPDTLSSTGYVEITGRVTDFSGNTLDDFNGTVYPIVYDKPDTIQTLGNDQASPVVKFAVRNKILFKGKASVRNGTFKFGFVVPVDISYKNGFGKISYYAHSEYLDAMGYLDSIAVYGYDTNGVTDTEGPEINLFFNDTLFQDGNITDENPVLLAFLFDSSGINTTGNGVGHDIMCVLDYDFTNAVILNEYYSTDKDNFRSGSLQYRYYDIPEGAHELLFRAWDVLNNYNEATISFEVVNSGIYQIQYLANYPNPFTDKTNFVFKHNHPNEPLHITLNIYDLSGRKIYSRNENITTEGYTVGPIVWNGTNNYGQKISGGVYIAEIIVVFENGPAESIRKKIILIR